jgi:hypothetical protein
MSQEHSPDQAESIRRIWQANEEFHTEKLVTYILEPLEQKGGLDTNGLWEHVLAVAFGRSVKTFEAIQRLCNLGLARRYWDDAFVLTRSHYETFVTLEWMARDTELRSNLFCDEYSLKMAHFLDLMGPEREDVRPESREEIIRERNETLKRHGRGSGTLQLLPSLKERVQSLTEPLKETVPNMEWEYEFYYRDVSGFAHPSGWGMTLSLANSHENIPTVECSPRVGYNALSLNGAWFFRILRRWNATFHVVPNETVDVWHKEWIHASGIVGE